MITQTERVPHIPDTAREFAEHFAERWESLPPIRKEVIRKRACGMTSEEIAESLFVSPQTVKGHLWQAFKSLGLPPASRGTTIALVTYLLGRYDEARLSGLRRNGGSHGT